MLHPEYPVVSFLSVVLLVCSAPSHFRARNVATISLILWLAVLSLIRGINSIVWAGNIDVKWLVWCDITTKINIGFSFAIPASALCLMIHLENISSARAARITAKDKRRRQIFEFVMCFVVPLVFMALHYIVQGHRFDVYPDQGCFPTIYISLPAVFILWFPPLVFSSISFIFAALSLRHFLRHRISFSSHLQNGSSMNAHRYFRLMALALVEMIWDLGTNIWILCSNLAIPLRPWTNWADVHSNFSRVQAVPYILLPQSIITANIFNWWILPISCFLVFIIFGTGREAVADYRAAFNWFRCKVIRQKVSNNTSSLLSLSLPIARRAIHVSIPASQADTVSSQKFEGSAVETPSSRISTIPPFDARSLSRSSVSSDATSEPSPTFPPALPNPSTKEEPSLPMRTVTNAAATPSAEIEIDNRRSSDLQITVSEPFLDTTRWSWRSIPTVQSHSQLDQTDRRADPTCNNSDYTIKNEYPPV